MSATASGARTAAVVRPAARRASPNTAAAPSTSVASAQGSETASAMKPMNGGPARKPSDPIDDTAAMPGPGGVSGCRPAALNISGTPFATPRPTRKRPASPAAGVPASRKAASGSAVSSAPPRSRVTGPTHRLTASPSTRPAVMPPAKKA